jgi:hypothetical protein
MSITIKGVFLSVLILATSVLMSGCAGTGDSIPVSFKPAADLGKEPAPSGPVVAVSPFEDGRSDRASLGARHTVWGREKAFTFQGGTPGELTAQAFASFLKKKGWKADYMKNPAEADNADIHISGKILVLSVDAQGAIGGTNVVAKSKVLIQAKNKADGSKITDTVSHSGSYRVFWFEDPDAEEILSDVVEKNFDQFVASIRIDGNRVAYRQ